MPELRPRRNPDPITKTQPRKATVRTRRNKKNSNNNQKQKKNNNQKQKKAAVARKRRWAEGGPVIETRSFKEDIEEEASERAMDEYDSGGHSGDKGLAADDEGAAPIPEKVTLFFSFSFFTAGIPFHFIFLEKLIYFSILGFCLDDVWDEEGEKGRNFLCILFVPFKVSVFSSIFKL